MPRIDGRKAGQLRGVRIVRNYIKHAEGSVLIEFGDTVVICAASVEDRQPRFMVEQRLRGEGWITSEYSMLPRATAVRTQRESTRGSQGGRTQEIQRLIGRSLRAVVDRKLLGERTIWVDCDVIQADGGTRTASITGGFVALSDACAKLRNQGLISENPIIDFVAAISVGIIKGEPMLDLCYDEDSEADVDMNVVMTGRGEFVEIQGTAEANPFSKDEAVGLIDLAASGIRQLISLQQKLILKGTDEVNSRD